MLRKPLRYCYPRAYCSISRSTYSTDDLDNARRCSSGRDVGGIHEELYLLAAGPKAKAP